MRPRKPWLAALLSLWLPGLGQLYAGAWKRAIFLPFAVPLLFWSAAFTGLPKTFPGFLLWLALIPLCYLAVLWDAIRLARVGRDYHLRWFNRWYLYLALGLLASWVTLPFALIETLPARSFQIPSQSMEPTLQPGDHLLTDVTYWRDHTPARGDLVVLQSPEAPGYLHLKRVVALPGEEVSIRDKQLLIDGRPLASDWGIHQDPAIFPDSSFVSLEGRKRDQLGPVAIPAGSVFLLGDNRDFSYDSRFYGPVPLSLLHAKPLFLYCSNDRSRIGRRLETR